MADKKRHRSTRTTHRPATASRYAARTAGLATTAMAGALVLAITAPQATASASPSVLLTTSASSLQPVIDQILAAEQAAIAQASALPFATAGDNAMLPAIVQNTTFEFFQILMSAANNTGKDVVFNKFPSPITGDAADPRQAFGFNDPTIQYSSNFIDPNASYVLHGTVGSGTGAISINPQSANGTGGGQVVQGLDLGSNLKVNPDGTYTVDVGPTEPSGAQNYLDSADFNSLLIRYAISNTTLNPGSINIDCVADCPVANPGVTSTGLSDTAINSLLHQLAAGTAPFNDELAGISKGMGFPVNTTSPLIGETGSFSTGNPSAVISTGNFDLQPGQALIVKVPDVGPGYQSIELMNVFGATLPGTLAQTSLNDSQTFNDPDGYTYYVISATNPGVANWLDTGGLTRGTMITRLEGVPTGTDVEGEDVTTKVVPVADISKYLPVDTPAVSPEQYAADMTQRVLGADYALDNFRQSGQPDWVTEQLWLHDLQSAMGSDDFDKVFGSDPVTPMWLRLTPALSPDMFTVLKAFLADPSASMAAIQDNLALAEKDISAPIQLAEALLQKDPSSFFSVLNEALFNPNTSIIAGILNARDDLATAIMAASKDGFPTEAGPIATWEWEHMSELTQMTPGTAASDLGSLFNLGDLLGS